MSKEAVAHDLAIKMLSITPGESTELIVSRYLDLYRQLLDKLKELDKPGKTTTKSRDEYGL